MKLDVKEKLAFQILAKAEQLEKDFSAINILLSKQSDFMRFDYCQDELFSMVIDLLDLTLGKSEFDNSGIVSYYFWDKPKNGGSITHCALNKEGKTWKIKTIADLKKYYLEAIKPTNKRGQQ